MMESSLAIPLEQKVVTAINVGYRRSTCCIFGRKSQVVDVLHETLRTGNFNSPRGVATNSERNIIVAEFSLGKLTRSIESNMGPIL